MTAPELLERLRPLGVRLEARGDQLRVEAPVGAIPPSLREELRRLKPELVRLLQLQPGYRQSWYGLWPPPRDPDPSGCPTHWLRVPELPPRGSRVAMADRDGYGTLYRFAVGGCWYLLKFLPPFDGRLSLTDPDGRVRVLASLEEATGWLAWMHGEGGPS